MRYAMLVMCGLIAGCSSANSSDARDSDAAIGADGNSGTDSGSPTAFVHMQLDCWPGMCPQAVELSLPATEVQCAITSDPMRAGNHLLGLHLSDPSSGFSANTMGTSIGWNGVAAYLSTDQIQIEAPMRMHGAVFDRNCATISFSANERDAGPTATVVIDIESGNGCHDLQGTSSQDMLLASSSGGESIVILQCQVAP